MADERASGAAVVAPIDGPTAEEAGFAFVLAMTLLRDAIGEEQARKLLYKKARPHLMTGPGVMNIAMASRLKRMLEGPDHRLETFEAEWQTAKVQAETALPAGQQLPADWTPPSFTPLRLSIHGDGNAVDDGFGVHVQEPMQNALAFLDQKATAKFGRAMTNDQVKAWMSMATDEILWNRAHDEDQHQVFDGSREP